ncbi:DUF4384 domain-containing protein [Sedimentitalea sp. JM2-8]|uniref:DUF4384 domain-containing protein n=1 Tax=Sedimentitalea xiamensis TaxID=3050037 RepID=A0ABT7FI88_9RHOB|nr:DUF4384 domain-containing protein [Sedimentitalea xiamensis]MDK3074826.1 DUF4384 domain-containing protein [Sedimentitalea xiamensis]
MTGRTAIWIAGLGASVTLHVAAIGALPVLLKPDPITQQQPPRSELDVQAYQLDRSQARRHQPDAEAAARVDAETTAAASSGIPATRAEPAAIAPVPTALTKPVNPDVAKAARPQTALQRPLGLDPMNVGASDRAGERLTLAQPEIRPARVAVADAATVEQTTPETSRTEAAPPPGQTVSLSDPDLTPAVSLEQDAVSLTAALAFSGEGSDQIDPKSLAAFQSFTRPEDSGLQGDTLRDGVGALLSQVPCSRLQVSFDPDSATLQVNGHVPDADLRGPVLAALQTQMGTDIALSDSIRILPRPQCGALAGISNVGLAQSTDQNTNPLVIGADAQARVLTFVKDDRLFFDLTAPDYDAYVYVDYFDAGGNVLHLVPNEQSSISLVPAETPFRVGARDENDTGLQIFVGPPYGQEIVVAFAASSLLYDETRPLVEPAADYLAWLKDRVARARRSDPGFKGEWVYFLVVTTAT